MVMEEVFRFSISGFSAQLFLSSLFLYAVFDFEKYLLIFSRDKIDLWLVFFLAFTSAAFTLFSKPSFL